MLGTPRTNAQTLEKRQVSVVGILSTRPKTRYFVTERTWAYQTKSAFSDILIILFPVGNCKRLL